MPTREIVYPEYGVAEFEGGDIRLSFNPVGSKFGPVHVVLIRDDAEGLLSMLEKAIVKSYAGDERQ